MQNSEMIRLVQKLVPNAKMNVVDGEIIAWLDERPQPTKEQIEEVENA